MLVDLGPAHLCPVTPSLPRLLACEALPSFYVCFRDLNSSPLAFTPSAFPNDLSSHVSSGMVMSFGVPSLISQFCCGYSRTRLALMLLPVSRGVDCFFTSGLFIWSSVHFPASGELIHLFLLWFSTPSLPLYWFLQCTALYIYWPWSSYRMVCPLTCYTTQPVDAVPCLLPATNSALSQGGQQLFKCQNQKYFCFWSSFASVSHGASPETSVAWFLLQGCGWLSGLTLLAPVSWY